MSDTQHRSKRTNSLSQLLELWLETLDARCCSQRTIVNHRGCVGKFIEFLNQETPDCTPEDVGPEHIRRWIIKRRNDGISSHTLHDDFRNPRTFWNWMLFEELTENNPFAKVQPPRKEKLLKPDLTPEQVDALLQATSGKQWFELRDRALILLLLDTGLRIHEAHRLTPACIGNDSLIIRGKGGKQRFVYLSPQVRLAIHRYLKFCPYEIGDDDPLWRGFQGPYSLNGLQQSVRTVGERAGVTPLGPHQLRRTFATWSLRSGCDIETLRRLMGHSSLAILQQYLSLVENDLKNAHEKHSPIRQLDIDKKGRKKQS